jgi:DNA-binding SARP family transcriptional activator
MATVGGWIVGEVRVWLFGVPEIYGGLPPSQSLEGRKAQELFCYLLLTRGRQCSRETLATLLWPEVPPERAKKYLRQATWRIHATLDSPIHPSERVLTTGPEWLQIADDAPIWCDVEAFETAIRDASGVRDEALDAGQARRLHQAVALYRGDLLETWYQDWCLFERERLQNVYLALLDKLCVYHERRGEPEPAIALALRILRIEPARELSHRGLMRLYLLAGDRTAALRQFERCKVALRDELGVQPAGETTRLYHSIRGDGAADRAGFREAHLDGLVGTVDALRRLQPSLTELQAQLERHIAALDRFVARRADVQS